MLIKHNILLYFLFIVSTYCGLIPNDRVVTDPGSNFDLVEGISYNIIHWRSSSNLDGENKVHVSHESSSYQHWTLRKANGDGLYNIISTESGRNLDSNGRIVYVSTPQHNSIFNPYQHWVFKKVKNKNNTYNIVHVISQRNLDSDGKKVYIGKPGDNSETNPHQQWIFEPKNYNLTAVTMDFTYPPDLEETLDQFKTRTTLFSGDYIIDNNANVTIEHTIDRTEKKLNSYSLEIRKSDSVQTSKHFSMSFSMSGVIFGILGIHTGFVKGITHGISSTYGKIYKESVVEEVIYRSCQKIIVPPFVSVVVNSSVDKISINIPFKAKIRISGKGDRLDDSGKVISMTDVDVNALRCYLQKENFDREIVVEGNSIVVGSSGVLKVDGYGLETKLETVEIPVRDPPVRSEPSTSSFISYFIIIVIAIVISYWGVKLYLSRRIGHGYNPI